MIKEHLYSELFVSVLITSLFYAFYDFYLFSIFSIFIFIYFGLKIFNELGKKIEIRDIMIFIAILQWLIGPILSYRFTDDKVFYFMIIGEEEYVNYVFPATFFLIIGLYLPIFGYKFNENLILKNIYSIIKQKPNIDITLIAIGIVSEILINYVPLSLRFAFSLLGSLRYIGLYYLMVGKRPFKWIIFSIIMLWLLYIAIDHTVFQSFILWAGFMFLIIAFLYKLSKAKKISIIILFVSMVFIIQTVKYEFRQLTWFAEGKIDNKMEIFTNLVKKNLSRSDLLFSEANIQALISRINQGWIIARIMYYIPVYEPYAEGETIKIAIASSLLPRFIYKDKITAGGNAYFERFTGLNMGKSTSMDLSIVGEAYANYGKFWGIVFMFFLGISYNAVLYIIFRISLYNPTILFWIPLIFFQVIKAESDLATSLNHLTKASMLVFAFFWSAKNIWGVRL